MLRRQCDVGHRSCPNKSTPDRQPQAAVAEARSCLLITLRYKPGACTIIERTSPAQRESDYWTVVAIGAPRIAERSENEIISSSFVPKLVFEAGEASFIARPLSISDRLQPVSQEVAICPFPPFAPCLI